MAQFVDADKVYKRTGKLYRVRKNLVHSGDGNYIAPGSIIGDGEGSFLQYGIANSIKMNKVRNAEQFIELLIGVGSIERYEEPKVSPTPAKTKTKGNE